MFEASQVSADLLLDAAVQSKDLSDSEFTQANRIAR